MMINIEHYQEQLIQACLNNQLHKATEALDYSANINAYHAEPIHSPHVEQQIDLTDDVSQTTLRTEIGRYKIIGCTPVMAAILSLKKDNDALIQLLLDKGADVTAACQSFEVETQSPGDSNPSWKQETKLAAYTALDVY